MDSMYGGQPGVSFVLKENFSTYDEMVAAFKQGASYTNVWYGEYCLISSKNKNHPDNGKIYKRGLDYQNATTGGAIYLGCIVGSSSGTPFVQVGTIDAVSAMSKAALEDNTYRRYPVGLNADGTVKTNWQYNETTHSWYDAGGDIKDDFSFGEETESIVPGKVVNDDGSVTYNDEIKYTWVNIRKDDEDEDSWFYVGFEFPYLVTDYSAHHVSQYDDSGNIKDNAATVERIDDQTHPYYQSWELGIPKGLKGDTLRNLRVIVPTNLDKSKIYEASAIKVDASTGLTTLGDPGYDGIDDDITSQRKIVVFDYYVYDKRVNPDPVMIYLGDFNIITGINVDDDGTLTVSYSHDDDTVYTKKIKWVSGVELTTGNGSKGGHFTLGYNNGDTAYETDLTWIKGIEISENGTVTYTYAGTNGGAITDDGKKVVSNFLKWVTGVSLTTGDGNLGGHFKLDYNNGDTSYETDLTWVKGIEIADNGDVTYTYSGTAGGDIPSDGKKIISNLVRWISDVSLDTGNGHFAVSLNTGETAYEGDLNWVKDVIIDQSTGDITIRHTTGDETSDAKLRLLTRMDVDSTGVATMYFNTGESETVKTADGLTDYHIKTVNKISLNTGIDEDKHITVLYNTGETARIGDPINYIQDMVVRPSDWHLFVLFNDSTHRATSDSIVSNVIYDDSGTVKLSGSDASGVSWLSNSQVLAFMGSKYNTFGSDVYWRDYGAIKDQGGVLIGFNILKTDVETAGYTEILDYLNAKYPSGLTGESNIPGGASTKEKIVTYQPSDDEKADKEFYAFDYNTMTWYFLGRIADTGSRDVKLLAKTEISSKTLEKLNTEGLAFITYAVTASDTAIPTYWKSDYQF